jgi:hypothetical protein
MEISLGGVDAGISLTRPALGLHANKWEEDGSMFFLRVCRIDCYP